jgi:glycosyltransferase involved in cell wall biosynthesis
MNTLQNTMPSRGEPAPVMLLRKHPTPTEEMYFLWPIQELIDHDALDVRIIQSKAGLGKKKAFLSSLLGAHVVAVRYLPRGWLRVLKEVRGELAGLTYIVDDDIPAARETADLPRDYRRRLIKAAQNDFWPMLDLADTLITTSTTLFERYASDRTFLLEPGLFLPLPDEGPCPNEQSLRMAFFATAMHQPDLEMIAPALEAVHDRHPQVQLDMIVSRNPPSELSGLPRVSFYPPMPWADYKCFLQRQRAHILLAPKQETPYNKAKSFIKVLDAAQLGAVGVYSNVRPYNEVVEHGRNGLLVDNTPKAWFDALEGLISNPAKTSELRQGARELALRIGNPERLTAFWKKHLCRPRTMKEE